MQHTPRGDEHELYQQLNAKLVNVICKHFRLSHDDARDVAQFAWLKFLERQPARINVFGWLYTTAKFEAYSRSRRGQRQALTLWAQGYRYKEIAERLGKTYTWTNRHITEGLRSLRQAMAREPG
jgi:DNA-directed RNA polymerase specialized sigma24 family protein